MVVLSPGSVPSLSWRKHLGMLEVMGPAKFQKDDAASQGLCLVVVPGAGHDGGGW